MALGLAALAPVLAAPDGSLPPWGFVVFVVLVDVAHVWSTLFRTYLDDREIARRPGLYAGVPLACFAAGVALYSASPALFWTVLAYVALTHFIRQQIGWVAIYRARQGGGSLLDRVVDDAAVYAGTLYPVLYWHASLPRPFSWFVAGDFIGLPLEPALGALRWGWVAVLSAYGVRAAHRALTTGVLEVGKHVVVLTTAATWYVGIVATSSDFAFTVANVIVHGVPYFALLWAVAKQKSRAAEGVVRRVVRRGLAAFFAVLAALALAEELLWDRLVWHAEDGVFRWLPSVELGAPALALIVPLLAVPQATHYVLDAFIWRRRDTGDAEARAIGFERAPT
ncbi:MAG: hypothetical protein IPM79_36935 [Polyangiaceae bacterium]|nr:hypothetical protein [Polyangiaceae bacterium]MBK8943041.1 hypothetical protein [Polyangiaceae bacterium]